MEISIGPEFNPHDQSWKQLRSTDELMRKSLEHAVDLRDSAHEGVDVRVRSLVLVDILNALSRSLAD